MDLKKSEVVISKYDEWESLWLTGDSSLLKVCHMVIIVSIALFESCFENLFKVTATTLLIPI